MLRLKPFIIFILGALMFSNALLAYDRMYFVGAMRPLDFCVELENSSELKNVRVGDDTFVAIAGSFYFAYTTWMTYLTNKGLRKDYDANHIYDSMDFPTFKNLDPSVWKGFTPAFVKKAKIGMVTAYTNSNLESAAFKFAKDRKDADRPIEYPTLSDIRGDPPMAAAIEKICKPDTTLKIIVGKKRSGKVRHPIAEVSEFVPRKDGLYEWPQITLRVDVDFSDLKTYLARQLNPKYEFEAVSIHDPVSIARIFAHEIGHLLGIPHIKYTIMDVDVLRDLISLTSEYARFTEKQRFAIEGELPNFDHPKMLLLPHAGIDVEDGTNYGIDAVIRSIWQEGQFRDGEVQGANHTLKLVANVNTTFDLNDKTEVMKRPEGFDGQVGTHGSLIMRQGPDDNFFEYRINAGSKPFSPQTVIKVGCGAREIVTFTSIFSYNGRAWNTGMASKPDTDPNAFKDFRDYFACQQKAEKERNPNVDFGPDIDFFPEKDIMAGSLENMKKVQDAIARDAMSFAVEITADVAKEYLYDDGLGHYCGDIPSMKGKKICLIAASKRAILYYFRDENSISQDRPTYIASDDMLKTGNVNTGKIAFTTSMYFFIDESSMQYKFRVDHDDVDVWSVQRVPEFSLTMTPYVAMIYIASTKPEPILMKRMN